VTDKKTLSIKDGDFAVARYEVQFERPLLIALVFLLLISRRSANFLLKA